ncbi:hypothetical protein PCCS19_33020 [Paenibacillus sp. CCS19]|uniref:hypothetical protein n=1 Tax=Paenibacillus sp. CCS19 TaxID=3158387 RepID=UPI00256383FB|nr:hypothetical protein [Paenibacillus cellulosilyticus]GMK40247.1 hypothetical protein PCCS19_33020 [Paenibacillus cellulosilyticus]
MAKEPAQPESKSNAPKFAPQPVSGSSLPPQSELASAQQSFGNSAVLNYLRSSGGAAGPQMSMAPVSSGGKYSSGSAPNMSKAGDTAPFDQLVKSLGGTDKPAVKAEVVKKVMALNTKYPTSSEKDNSGAMAAKVARGTTEFDALVENSNPDIIFKDEEGTGDDLMMTPRMKEKLDRLAELVKAEWPDRKLRATDVWDDGTEHDGTSHQVSLHYEGRAADITVSDDQPGNALLGRLGELAKEAGFDWVWYENALHVHVSVKKEEPAAPTPAPAAAPAATVPTSALGPSAAQPEFWPMKDLF